MFFAYGETEIEYLRNKDKVLGEAIEKIGHISWEINDDIFSSIIFHIIGQQISISALNTIWKRMRNVYGTITPKAIIDTELNDLQKFGITFKKAGYMHAIARIVERGEIILDKLWEMSDSEVISELIKLPGVGRWTSEMILIFCMQRPDVFSFGDLAIHRGLRMLYHHRTINKDLFEKYRRRFSPYGSVASLYIWEISCGAIEGLRDYAPKKNK